MSLEALCGEVWLRFLLPIITEGTHIWHLRFVPCLAELTNYDSWTKRPELGKLATGTPKHIQTFLLCCSHRAQTGQQCEWQVLTRNAWSAQPSSHTNFNTPHVMTTSGVTAFRSLGRVTGLDRTSPTCGGIPKAHEGLHKCCKWCQGEGRKEGGLRLS